MYIYIFVCVCLYVCMCVSVCVCPKSIFLDSIKKNV